MDLQGLPFTSVSYFRSGCKYETSIASCEKTRLISLTTISHWRVFLETIPSKGIVQRVMLDAERRYSWGERDRKRLSTATRQRSTVTIGSNVKCLWRDCWSITPDRRASFIKALKWNVAIRMPWIRSRKQIPQPWKAKFFSNFWKSISRSHVKFANALAKSPDWHNQYHRKSRSCRSGRLTNHRKLENPRPFKRNSSFSKKFGKLFISSEETERFITVLRRIFK